MNENISSQQPSQPQPEFAIQRLYIKDISFESPLSPRVFFENVQPNININITTASALVNEGLHEVILTVTVTATVNNDDNAQTLFLIEVKQAGIFSMKNIPEQNMGIVLGVTCPTILFPFAREVIAELASKGGFPNFYLAPINFEALYLNDLQKKQGNIQTGSATQQ